MPKMKKLGADAVKEAAMGHNKASEECCRGHIEYVAKKMIAMQGINGDIKDRLRKAKEDGIPKMAIRAAVKRLMMSEEQLQSREEVEHEAQILYDLGAEMPLFSAYRRGTGDERGGGLTKLPTPT